MPDLRVRLGRLELKNPVMPAAGTFGYGEEYAPLIDLKRLGAIVTKGISLKPTEGNPPPRVWETTGGIINSIGLHNIGVERFATEKLPFLRQLDVPIIVNFFGATIDEYEEAARRISQLEGVAAIEANLSCPNVKSGGLQFGISAKMVSRITKKILKSANCAVIIKLSSQVANIVEIAKAAAGEGADAITLINAVSAMAIDIERQRPVLGGVTGGLSGPAIKPIALKAVWDVIQEVDIPIIGVGGIMCWKDAVEFLMAGATAIQVGTASFIHPPTMIEVIEGIEAFLQKRGYQKVAQIMGCVHR